MQILICHAFQFLVRKYFITITFESIKKILPIDRSKDCSVLKFYFIFAKLENLKLTCFDLTSLQQGGLNNSLTEIEGISQLKSNIKLRKDAVPVLILRHLLYSCDRLYKDIKLNSSLCWYQ